MDPSIEVVYQERARIVAALLAMARQLGWTHGAASDTEQPEWPVVLIDLPTGQVSWHISANDFALFFADVPPYPGTWDGHTTDEKYRRLDALVRLFSA